MGTLKKNSSTKPRYSQVTGTIKKIDTIFGAIHHDTHFDMKIDYTISRTSQKTSLSELETLHHFCELDCMQIIQSLILAVLKIPHAR